MPLDPSRQLIRRKIDAMTARPALHLDVGAAGRKQGSFGMLDMVHQVSDSAVGSSHPRTQKKPAQQLGSASFSGLIYQTHQPAAGEAREMTPRIMWSASSFENERNFPDRSVSNHLLLGQS
jgi:hypothetical protein